MENEINTFIMVWITIFMSVCYCYAAAKIIAKGTARLLIFMPVVCLFLALPLNLKSVHLGCTTAFFIAWLANFKLLLFALGMGPLSDPSLSLGRFAALACFPIRIHKDPPIRETQEAQNVSKKPLKGPKRGSPSPTVSRTGAALKSPFSYAAEALLLAFLVSLGYRRDYFHPMFYKFVMCLYIYIGLELLLAVTAYVAQTMLGSELDRPFDDPYLSSSLRDLWGRRWNLMVSEVLYLTIYSPIRSLTMPALGTERATMSAIFGTFIISGLMHELLLFYLGRVRPNWTALSYFLIHGLSLMVELRLRKKFIGCRQLPRPISGLLTFGFAVVTLIWLVVPELQRMEGDVKALEEIKTVETIMMSVASRLSSHNKV